MMREPETAKALGRLEARACFLSGAVVDICAFLLASDAIVTVLQAIYAELVNGLQRRLGRKIGVAYFGSIGRTEYMEGKSSPNSHFECGPSGTSGVLKASGISKLYRIGSWTSFLDEMCTPDSRLAMVMASNPDYEGSAHGARLGIAECDPNTLTTGTLSSIAPGSNFHVV